MYAKTFGETVCGINGEEIIVEVDISNGLPGFDIVGLPDTAVKESRERVRAALKNSGLMFPMTRITVNLAPADLRKDGSSLDLPIAVGILTAAGSLLQEEAEGKKVFAVDVDPDALAVRSSGDRSAVPAQDRHYSAPTTFFAIFRHSLSRSDRLPQLSLSSRSAALLPRFSVPRSPGR